MVYYIHSNEITNLGWNPSLRLRRARDVGMFHANSATNLSSFDTTPRIFSGTIKVLKNISQCPFYTFPHIYCTSSIKRSWPINIECTILEFFKSKYVDLWFDFSPRSSFSNSQSQVQLSEEVCWSGFNNEFHIDKLRTKRLFVLYQNFSDHKKVKQCQNASWVYWGSYLAESDW